MKIQNFEYTVSVSITFTKQEIDRIMYLGCRHYDTKCRQACQPGGFIKGLANQLEYPWGDEKKDTSTVEATLNFDQIDTIAKIGEAERFDDRTNDIGLTHKCTEIMNKMRSTRSKVYKYMENSNDHDEIIIALETIVPVMQNIMLHHGNSMTPADLAGRNSILAMCEKTLDKIKEPIGADGE